MVCSMKYVRSTLDVRGVRSDLESRLKTGDLAHYPLPEDSQSTGTGVLSYLRKRGLACGSRAGLGMLKFDWRMV